MRRVLIRLLSAVGLSSLVIVLAAPGVGAQTALSQGPAGNQGAWDAVTAAYGFDSTLSNPSIPAVTTIEGAGPTAQAHLSSLGQSDGFASFPYPGDTVVGLTGLASAAFLNGFPVPPYPFYVSTSIGSPPASATFPGITLDSESDADRATSKAVVGTEGTGYTATATISQAADSTVTATSTAVFSAVQTGTDLLLSGVVSTATETLNPDGSLHGSSSLSIGQISAPGLQLILPKTTPSSIGIPQPIPGLPQPPPIQLPPIPLPFGGTTLNNPNIGFEDGQFTLTLLVGGTETFAIPANAVLAAFKALGIDMTYQSATKTANGVVAPTLTLQTVLPSLPSNQYFNGPTPISITLGRSTASIDEGAPPPPSGVQGTTPGGSSGSPAVNQGPTSPGTALPTSAPATTSASTGGLGTSRPTGGGTGSATRVALGPPTSIFTQRKVSVLSIYLLLVGVAFMLTFGGQVLRYLGVRTIWRS